MTCSRAEIASPVAPVTSVVGATIVRFIVAFVMATIIMSGGFAIHFVAGWFTALSMIAVGLLTLILGVITGKL